MSNIRPRRRQSSERNTIMTNAERYMKGPYLWAIHDVKARTTTKYKKRIIKKLFMDNSNYGNCSIENMVIYL